jgi:hypothetical protein
MRLTHRRQKIWTIIVAIATIALVLTSLLPFLTTF